LIIRKKKVINKMSTYICEKCGCIDNTACGGNYWGVMSKRAYFKDDYANKHVLCVECTPSEYCDGSISEEAGKWHNKFPKRHWSAFGTKDEVIAHCLENQGNIVNAVDYFAKKV
jgi:hypothetical protein